MNAKRQQSMGSRALMNTLLELDSNTATSSADGVELAQRILRRDRLRVRILIGATITFFLLAVVGIFGSFLMFYTFITPKMNKVLLDTSKLTGAERVLAGGCQVLYQSQIVGLWIISASVAALLMAAVCTVLLLLATRRATLRQIQASLQVLSEQVETLQQSLRASQSAGTSQAQKERGG